MMRIVSLMIISLFLQACTTVGSADRPDSYYQSQVSDLHDGLIDDAVLGDSDKKIIDLLNYQVKLTDKNRIAVLKLSKDSNWRFYSDDFTELNDSLAESLITKLRSSNRIYDASFLPSMLVSEKRTIPVLREAAARFQADLLLVYRSSCQSYQKYNLIDPNETKSYCSVESALLDVRSGIIVKSIVSSEDYSALKVSGDKNFQETIKKAELEAIAKALGSIANQIVLFLNDVPRIQGL